MGGGAAALARGSRSAHKDAGGTNIMRILFLLAGLAVAAPGLAGTVLSDKLEPFAIASPSGAVNGTLQVRVVRNAAGKLAFYWKINVSAASTGAVQSLSF